jgi:hypothetical protein
MNGWISIHRKIVENPMWLCEPFTRAQAWIDLLLLANHKDGFIVVRGVRLDVKRGQVGYSIESLRKRWKWSRGKVERFINELESEHQIVKQTGNQTGKQTGKQKKPVSTVISITKYDEYQANGNETGNQTGKQTDKQTGNQKVNRRVTNNNDNNGNKVRPAFLNFWEAHPKYSEAGFTPKQKIRGPHGMNINSTDRKIMIWEMCQHISPQITKGNARWYFIKITDKNYVTHEGDDMDMEMLYNDIAHFYSRGWLETATENDKPVGLDV